MADRFSVSEDEVANLMSLVSAGKVTQAEARATLVSIRSRAAQQGATAVYQAASKALATIDGDKRSAKLTYAKVFANAVDLQAAAPEGEWPELQRVQVLPWGKVEAHHPKAPWYVTEDGAKSIVAHFNARRTDFPVSWDHFGPPQRASSAPVGAAGWIESREIVAPKPGEEPNPQVHGVWDTIRWTPKAREALASREFRYYSPEMYHSKDGTIMAISGGGLTNYPAIEGMLPVAANAQPEDVFSVAFNPYHGEGGKFSSAEEASTAARAEGVLAGKASDLAHDTRDWRDHKEASQAHTKAALAHAEAAKMQRAAGNQKYARSHDEMFKLHTQTAAAHQKISETAHGTMGVGYKPNVHSTAKQVSDAVRIWKSHENKVRAATGKAPVAPLEALEYALAFKEPDRARDGGGSWTADGQAASDRADQATQDANDASMKSLSSSDSKDHADAKAAHQKASDAHAAAQKVHEKAGDAEGAQRHEAASAIHQHHADVHGQMCEGTASTEAKMELEKQVTEFSVAYNPYHAPAGSGHGGEFTSSGDSGGGPESPSGSAVKVSPEDHQYEMGRYEKNANEAEAASIKAGQMESKAREMSKAIGDAKTPEEQHAAHGAAERAWNDAKWANNEAGSAHRSAAGSAQDVARSSGGSRQAEQYHRSQADEHEIGVRRASQSEDYHSREKSYLFEQTRPSKSNAKHERAARLLEGLIASEGSRGAGTAGRKGGSRMDELLRELGFASLDEAKAALADLPALRAKAGETEAAVAKAVSEATTPLSQKLTESDKRIAELEAAKRAAEVETRLVAAKASGKVTTANEAFAKELAEKDGAMFEKWLAVQPVFAKVPAGRLAITPDGDAAQKPGDGLVLAFRYGEEVAAPMSQGEEATIVSKAMAYAKANSIAVDGPDFAKVVARAERGEV